MHAKRAGRILIENITYSLSGSNASNFLLDGEMVCLTGKITNIDNIIGKTSVMTLPEHTWPEHAMEFIAATNIPETVTKVYISSIGEVTIKPLKGNTNVSEVYLDSIRFARRNQDLLPFEWINYSGNFGEAQLYNNNNIVVSFIINLQCFENSTFIGNFLTMI